MQKILKSPNPEINRENKCNHKPNSKSSKPSKRSTKNNNGFIEKHSLLEIEFTEETRKKLIEELSLITANPYSDLELATLQSTQVLLKHLPYGIETKLDEALKSGEHPAILLKNCPLVTTLPPTPTDDGGSNGGKDNVSELFMISLGSILGFKPFLNVGEKSNTVVQNILPQLGYEKEQSSKSSNVRFDPHTETIELCHMISMLMLACLRGNKNAKTGFILIDTIVKSLSKPVIEKLMQCEYTFRSGASVHEPKQLHAAPVISVVNGKFRIRFNAGANRVTAQTTEGEMALEALRKILNDESNILYHTLSENETLVLLNDRLVHLRSPFKIGKNMSIRRWLQRVYFNYKIRL